MASNNISVIIPSYRNPKYLDICVQSLVENSTLPDSQIVIVVDGFEDESKDVLAKYENHPKVSILVNEKNQGMQYSLNVGVMQATNEYIFIVNDDNVFPRRWDARIMEDVKKYFAQNPLTCITVNQIEPTGPSMFYHFIKDFGHDTEQFRYQDYLNFEETFSEPDDANGRIFPFIVSKKHYLATGGLDTFYQSPNVCDWDYFLRLELLNFVFPRIKNVNLYHFGSVVTRKNAESPIFQAKMQFAREQYNFKWGQYPYNANVTNIKTDPSGQYRGFTV
jgi:glycosyltransferase involved in cell wall biosynthesis